MPLFTSSQMSHHDLVAIAKLGHTWYSCKTMEEKVQLFTSQKSDDHRKDYLSLERDHLVAFIVHLGDQEAIEAFKLLEQDDREQVLCTTALSRGRRDAARLLDGLPLDQAVATLLNAPVPGAISHILAGMHNDLRERALPEMARQLVMWKEKIFKSPKEYNYLPVTDELLKMLPRQLQQCHQCKQRYKEGTAMDIASCLTHSYHLAHGVNHAEICGINKMKSLVPE